VSQAIADLRAAALREMDGPMAGAEAVEGLTFDVPHKTKPDAAGSFEDDNWVARYPGPNVPHIGNGAGGPR
jgi:hypothetical protein